MDSILISSKAMEKEARERLLKEIEEARKRVKSVQYCIKTSDIYIWFFDIWALDHYCRGVISELLPGKTMQMFQYMRNFIYFNAL